MKSHLNLSSIRKEFEKNTLDESKLKKDPIKSFIIWFNEIKKIDKFDSNCMVLSTVDKEGFPSSRVMLLKEVNEKGFIFYTNYDSKKAKDIDINNKVSLTFFWNKLEKQVRVVGLAEKVETSISEKYFHSRPTDSQIGCWASKQSQELESRDILEKKFKDLKLKYKNVSIPKPPQWGGYLVKPLIVEFWQGRSNRLHDRIVFELNKNEKKWTIKRLYP